MRKAQTLGKMEGKFGKCGKKIKEKCCSGFRGKTERYTRKESVRKIVRATVSFIIIMQTTFQLKNVGFAWI